MSFRQTGVNLYIGVDAVITRRIYKARRSCIHRICDLLESPQTIVRQDLFGPFALRFVDSVVWFRRLLRSDGAEIVIVFRERDEGIRIGDGGWIRERLRGVPSENASV